MSGEHTLTFESDDYYGPTMKLEINCRYPGAVEFSINGIMSESMVTALTYTLYDDDDVKKVISELLAWLYRLDERRAGRG